MLRKKKTDADACCQGNSPAIEEACPHDARPLPASTLDPSHCPVSATPGLKVDPITVKAMLNAKGLRRLDGQSYRFCPAPECEVVYFDNAANSVFRKEDLTVRIGQKEKKDPIPLCYCFGFTLEDIRRDLAMRGRTDIPAVIAAEVKAGHCACEVKNPEGRCCLGNVAKAVKRIQAEASVGFDFDRVRMKLGLPPRKQ